jgi:hypothetical protein
VRRQNDIPRSAATPPRQRIFTIKQAARELGVTETTI